MNAIAILIRGNKSFLKALDGVEPSIVDKPGACGEWSIKDVLAHITMYEELFVEVFQGQLDKGKTVPTLVKIGGDHQKYNDLGISRGKEKSFEELQSEYTTLHEKVMGLLKKIPVASFRKVGTILWYGKEYSLDDLIVILNYGHKKEHGAQISQFKELHKR